MNEIKGYCPKCGCVLYYEPKDTEVKCYACDNSVTPSSARGTDKDVNSGQTHVFSPRFDDPDSAQVYVENFLSSYDYSDYVYGSRIELPGLSEAIEDVKIKNGNKGSAWLLDFSSVVVPMTKRLDACAELARRIGERYDPADNADAYEVFDSYTTVLGILIDTRDAVLARLNSDVEYARRFGLSEELLARMGEELEKFTERVNKLAAADDISDIPEYTAAKERLSEERRLALLENGVYAEDAYVSAINSCEMGEYGINNALDLFESIRGYKDADERIARINRYFSFHREFFCFMGKTYIFKKKAATAFDVSAAGNDSGEKNVDVPAQSTDDIGPSYSLFEIVNGEPAKHPSVVGITKIISCYGTRLYYFNVKGGICSYDLAEERENVLDVGEAADYKTDGNRHYVRVCRGGSAFVVKKKLRFEQEKKGCLEAFFGSKDTADEEGNNYSIILVNMREDSARVIVPELVDVADFYEDSLFYTVAEKLDSRTADDKPIYTTRLMLCELPAATCSPVLSEACEIHNVYNGKIIYTLWQPNALNRELHVYSIAAHTDVTVEGNMYSYVSVERGFIYYTVGNADYRPLIRNNLDGTDRREIMTNVERILFVRGEWIYVQRGSGTNAALLKLKLDGSRFVFICSQIKHIVRLTASRIYYIDAFDTLRMVRSDGCGDRAIAEDILFDPENPGAYIAFANDGIYYQRSELCEPGAKKKSLSLYKMNDDGREVRKIAFNIAKVQDFDSDTLYYSVDERARYRLTIPKGEKEKPEVRYEYFRLKHYYRLDKNTDTSELILTTGTPHGSTSYTSGCSGKTVNADIIYEPAPIVHTYKRRGLAAVGAVAGEESLAEKLNAAKRGNSPFAVVSGLIMLALFIARLCIEPSAGSVAFCVIATLISGAILMLVSGLAGKIVPAIPEVKVKNRKLMVFTDLIVLVLCFIGIFTMIPEPCSDYDNAVEIEVGDPAVVELEEYGDEYYLVFTPTETADYRVYSTSSNADPQVSLYEDYGDYISYQAGDSDSGEGDNFSLTLRLYADTTYYILCSMQNRRSDNSFFVNIEKQSYVNNGDTGRDPGGRDGTSFLSAYIAQQGTDYQVYIGSSGKKVYYEFTPTNSDNMAIQSSGGYDTRVTLYDSNYNQIDYDDDDGEGTNFYLSRYFASGNTYYIVVDMYSGTGSFTFRISH